MPDVACVPQRSVRELPERAAAFGAREDRGRRVESPLAQPIRTGFGGIGRRVLFVLFVAHREPVSRFGGVADEQLRHRRDGHYAIDGDVPDRAERHARDERFVGMLRDRDAAARLDRGEAARAVVETARHHDADDTRPVGFRGRAKQRIDGGTETVLARAVRETHEALLDEAETLIGGAMYTRPWRNTSPSLAYPTARVRLSSSSGNMAGASGDVCSTSSTLACRSAGKAPTSRITPGALPQSRQ